MTEKIWWYVARSGGIVAWGVLALAVVWGLLLTTRLFAGRPTPRWLLDLHRYLGGLAVVLTAVHLAGLVLDSYVAFGPADLFVPMASGWQPGAVAVGVIAMYLLVVVEATSLLQRRLPRRWWRAVHLTSFASFWLATVHGVVAGTDAGVGALRLVYLLSGAVVLFLTIFRVLAEPRVRDVTRRPARSAA